MRLPDKNKMLVPPANKLAVAFDGRAAFAHNIGRVAITRDQCIALLRRVYGVTTSQLPDELLPPATFSAMTHAEQRIWLTGVGL